MMCLTPVKWLGASNLYETVASDISRITQDEELLMILIEGLKWELWGIYTQRFFIPREGLFEHLNKIKNVFVIVSQNGHNDMVSHLIDGIDDLLEIIGDEK